MTKLLAKVALALSLLVASSGVLTAQDTLSNEESANSENSENTEQLTEQIEEALSERLSMVLYGPMEFDALEVEPKDDGGFFVIVDEAAIIDGPEFGTFGFIVSPLENDGEYVVDARNLPSEFEFGTTEFVLGKHSLLGTWSFDQGGFTTLDFQVSDLVATSAETVLRMDSLAFQFSAYDPVRDEIDGTLSLENFRFRDDSDGDDMSIASISMDITVGAQTLISPYAALRSALIDIGEFSIETLQSEPVEVLQAVSRMNVLFDHYDLSVNIDEVAMRDSTQEEVRTTFDNLKFQSAASELSTSNGQQTNTLSLNNLDASSADVGVTLKQLVGTLTADGVDGRGAYEISQEIYSKLSDEKQVINVGRLFDLYANFVDAGLDIEVADLAVKAEGNDVELGNLKAKALLKGNRSDESELLLKLAHETLKLASFSDPLSLAAMPQSSDLTLRLEGLPMGTVRQQLSEDEAPISAVAGDPDAVEALLRSIFSKIFDTLSANPPSIHMEQNRLTSETLDVKIDGQFDVDQESARLLVGGFKANVSGLNELNKAAFQTAASKDARARRFAGIAMGGLGFVRGFGKKEDDGSLLFDITLDKKGKVSLNGAPLPF